MRTAIHELNNTEGRYLAIDPAWDGSQGDHPTDRYLVYVKGAFDIGYMPLTIMDDRQARIEELLDADVPVLDRVPPTQDQIEYFEEMWTSKTDDFALILSSDTFHIYSRLYRTRMRVICPFYDAILVNMIEAGVEVLDDYPEDRLY